MMLSDIVQRVIEETGRPDAANMIQLIVQNSVRQVHAKAKFRRDIVEETIPVPSPAHTVRLTLPPHFRQFKDVAITDNFGRAMDVCDNIQPSSVLNQLSINNVNPTYYVAGSTYTVASNGLHLPIHYLYTSYYTVPPLENLGSTTWMTDLYPEAIVNYALFKVHSKVGNNEKANACYALYESQFIDVLDDQEVD